MQNFIRKTYKRIGIQQKKLVIFSYENGTYLFLRECCEISAHTDVPNLLSKKNYCIFLLAIFSSLFSFYLYDGFQISFLFSQFLFMFIVVLTRIGKHNCKPSNFLKYF